jgi:hypothetical protein
MPAAKPSNKVPTGASRLRRAAHDDLTATLARGAVEFAFANGPGVAERVAARCDAQAAQRVAEAVAAALEHTERAIGLSHGTLGALIRDRVGIDWCARSNRLAAVHAEDGSSLPFLVVPVYEAFATGSALEADAPKHSSTAQTIAIDSGATHTIVLPSGRPAANAAFMAWFFGSA